MRFRLGASSATRGAAHVARERGADRIIPGPAAQGPLREYQTHAPTQLLVLAGPFFGLDKSSLR